MKEGLKVGAVVTVERKDKSGNSIEKRVIHNTVVNTGYDLVSDLLGKPSSRPNPLGYVAVGTSTAATTASMTALGTQWGNRVATTYTHTASTTTFSLSCIIPAHTGSSVALTESGLFNASTSGTMFNRITFSAINKEAADTITITYVINLTDQ